VRDAPVDAEQRNARGTLNALEAARRCGVQRFV
jgi:nucleoside-diphosphate-sugar epimerase